MLLFLCSLRETRYVMKVSKELLRQLAQLSETDRTVLSVYLDLRSGWDAVKHFIERESRRLLPLLSEDERVHFEASLSLLLKYLNAKKAQAFTGEGVAFFADLGAHISRSVELSAAPEPMLAVDDEAIVHPLALQLDEYEPIGVIMIDAFCTRILIAAGQVMEDMDSMCKKIHHLSKAGGWSQMRYQRRRAKQVKHRAKDVVQKAVEIFSQAGVNRILIAGRDRMVSAIEQGFPKLLQDKVVATVRWDLNAPDDKFLRKIRPILEEVERTQERDLLEKLIGELKRHGPAVAGAKQTLQALKRGQVDTLLVSQTLDFNTSEELTSLAESTGGYVEFVPEGNQILEELGGVGAILRYKT
jgi:peptide chain release factor subunit 1